VPLINVAQDEEPEPEAVEVAAVAATAAELEPRKNGKAHRVENNGAQRNNAGADYPASGSGNGSGNGVRKNVRITNSDTGTHTIITVDKDAEGHTIFDADEAATTKS
jgi:hypothetical protein